MVCRTCFAHERDRQVKLPELLLCFRIKTVESDISICIPAGAEFNYVSQNVANCKTCLGINHPFIFSFRNKDGLAFCIFDPVNYC